MCSVVKSEPVKIADDYVQYDPNKASCGKFYSTYLKCVLITESQLRERTKQVAAEIHRYYGDREITLICVLKGGFRFLNLLLEDLHAVRTSAGVNHSIHVDFIRVKSYVNTQTTNDVKIIGPNPCEQYAGKDILIVEDIVDTGKTLTELLKLLEQNRLASIKVVTMVVKRLTHINVTYHPDFAGFSIPNEFVVGYGLDYNDYFREMNDICVMNEEGIKKFKM